MRRVYFKPKDMKGDTIVEVLICIAVVGAVITGAYALASHSLQEGISASEHTEALKLAESQIEALKFRNKTVSANGVWKTSIFSTTDDFCLDTAATSPAPAASWNPQTNSAGLDTSQLQTGAGHYNGGCVSPNTTNPKYFINIQKSAATPGLNGPTYLVSVRWTPPGGAPQSLTQLYYRF